MPSGIYVRTKEHGRRISESNKGRRNTDEARRRISEGVRSGLTKEVRKKMSDAKKGKPARNSYPIGYETDYKGNMRIYVKTDEGWKQRSRIEMEKQINRKLNSKELIHHKNGDSLDDRSGNLQIVSRHEHINLHRKYKEDNK